MNIDKVAVILTGRETVYLQWFVSKMKYHASEYTTRVFHSYSVGGPWTPIASGLRDAYSFRHTIQRRGRWDIPYYYIEITHRPSSQTVTSEVVFPEHPPDSKAIGISKKLEQRLRGEYGVETYFFKLRVEGEVDTEAFDKTLGRPTGKPGSSFGHKYKGAFYDPVHMWAKIGIDPWVLNVLSISSIGANQSSGWVARVPLITSGDMFVERNTNRRWRVGNQVQRFDRRLTLFRQVFVLNEIPLRDPEYDVAIPGQE